MSFRLVANQINKILNTFFLFFCKGCLNGGAQVRPTDGISVKDLSMQLEELYKTLPKSNPDNPDVQNIYNTFFDGSQSDKTSSLLHTKYHAVEKMNTALNIKW